MKKGFTLLELLAVIVVLAIIALIVTPFVANAIKNAKRGAFTASAYGMIASSEQYYGTKMIKNDSTATVITIDDGNVLPINFKYNGLKLEKGYIEINEQGKVRLYIWNEGFCAIKNYADEKVTVSETAKIDCTFNGPGVPTVVASTNDFTPDPVTVTVLDPEDNIEYQYNISTDSHDFRINGWTDMEGASITLTETEIPNNGEYYIFVRGVNESGAGAATSTLIKIDRTYYDLNITAPTGGTLTSSNPSYQLGKTVTLTLNLQPHYSLTSIKYNNHNVTEINDTTYTFLMPRASTNVVGDWDLVTYRLTVNPNGGSWNGITTTTGYDLVETGQQTMNEPIRSNYIFLGWKMSTTNNYLNGNTFTMGTTPVTLTATWTQKLYQVILAQNTNRLTRSNFNSVFTASNNGNTIYTSTASEGGVTVYYFAGNVTNNWVKFANKYWRIVRINENNSVRLIYVGNSASVTSPLAITNTAYYGNSTMPEYGKYKNGSVNSLVKGAVDDWYRDNINTSYGSYVSRTAIYCNEWEGRTIGSGDFANDSFKALTRLSASNRVPTFNCTNTADEYTIANGKLTYPVALLTADEAAFAGALYNTTSAGMYLNDNNSDNTKWWTMTPANYYHDNQNNKYQHMFSFDNRLTNDASVIDDRVGIRPVLSLKSCVYPTKGNGTIGSPYEITENTKVSDCATANN